MTTVEGECDESALGIVRNVILAIYLQFQFSPLCYSRFFPFVLSCECVAKWLFCPFPLPFAPNTHKSVAACKGCLSINCFCVFLWLSEWVKCVKCGMHTFSAKMFSFVAFAAHAPLAYRNETRDETNRAQTIDRTNERTNDGLWSRSIGCVKRTHKCACVSHSPHSSSSSSSRHAIISESRCRFCILNAIIVLHCFPFFLLSLLF